MTVQSSEAGGSAPHGARSAAGWARGRRGSVPLRVRDAIAALEDKDTLQGERLEIFPFLGSYLLGEAVDRVGADLAIHGHAHGGTEKGFTPGGIQVRNVAQPVINRAYNVCCLDCEAPAGD